MLNYMRDSLKGGSWPKLVLALVAVGLVAYLGAYFSCESGPRQGGDWAASVNGAEIPTRLFLTTARNIDQRYRELFGDNYEQFKQQAQIGTQAIQSLIERELILQDAARLGLAVSEEELVERIREADELKDPNTGKFVGKNRYVQVISRVYPGGVPAFEQALRDELLMAKWTDLVTQSVQVGDEELLEQFRRRTERTAVNYVISASADQEMSERADDAEVARWYEEHREDYMREEGRRLRYVTLQRQAVADGIEVSDDEVRAAYESNQASYQHPEQRRASHVLIRVEPNASDADRQRLRSIAEGILEQARAGEDFAGLARAHSQDPGSAERGGDLGFFSRGQMVPPFEEAAFATPVGQIAPLVESDFGYHVIEVTGAREAGVTPLADVADQIRRTLRLRRAQELVVSEAQRVRAGLQDGEGLDEIAAREGLTVESRFVARDDRLVDLGASPEFVQTVFDLQPGEVSPPLRTAPGMALVVVDEIVPPAVAPLEEVETAVRTDLRNQHAREAALNAARRALERHDRFAAVARALGKEVAESGDLAPGSAIPRTGGSTPEMQEKLFGPGVMEGDRGVVPVPAGALVYEVTRRQPFDSLAFEDAKASLREELLEQRRSALRRSVLEQMYRQQEVLINGELIEAYNG